MKNSTRISNTSERLKELMKIKNLRQIDIIEKCAPYCARYGKRIGRNDLSQYVNGKAEPRQDKLFILCQALSVDEAWLMGFDVPMERRSFDIIKEEVPKILHYYNQLNDIGKQEAEKRVEELTHLPRYTLEIKAAHNDHETEPGELEKMRGDLSKLKKPD